MSDPKSDESNMEMESSVSIAVVKPDHGAIIERMEENGFITAEQLDKVHSEMKAGESLLICAKAYAPECENHFANITIKKIPQMILGRCEFGKDNYDLNIIKATEAEAEESNEE